MSTRNDTHILLSLAVASIPALFGCEANDGSEPLPPASASEPASRVANVNPQSHLDDDKVIVDEHSCTDPEEDLPLVGLDWIDGGGNEFVEANSPGTVRLRLTNHTDSQVRLEVNLLADAGTMVSVTQRVGGTQLKGAASETIIVDLRDLKLDLGSMRTSGQLRATARVFVEDEGTPRDKALSRPIYFHPRKNGSLAVYNKSLLTSSFNGGNFRAFEDPANFPPLDLAGVEDGEPTITDRVVWGGPEILPAPDFRALGIEDKRLAADPPSRSNDQEADQDRATYSICALYQIETVDSGYTNGQGVKEDKWNNANTPTSVPAYGAVIKVGNTTHYTDPATGCVNVSKNTATHDIRIYAKAYDENDNYVRMHDGFATQTDSYPASTYSALILDKTLHTGITNYVSAGSYTPRWTAMAALAYSLYRYHDGVHDSEFHVAESTPTSGSCRNSNYGKDVDDNEMYIRIAGEECSAIGTWRKFIVAHEFGHALGYLHAERNGTPNGDEGNDTLPNACGWGGSSYANESKEWSSIGAREGWANFVAARVWNNSANNGTLRWVTATFDLTRWNNDDDPRGRLRNVCCSGSGCASSLNGAATIQDWMNAFWELETSSYCSPTPSRRDMLRFWSELINESPDKDEYFPGSVTAIDSLVSDGHIGSCYGSGGAAKWEFIGCHNGIDFTGSMPAGGC